MHRLVREGDPTFREELLNFSRKGRFLQLSNFKDDSSTAGEFLLLPTAMGLLEANEVLLMFLQRELFCFLRVTAWDCSVWVRAYALFLEERLQCFRVLKYDIEAERLPKVSPGQEEKVPTFFGFCGLMYVNGILFWEFDCQGYSKTRDLDGEQLLEQLPALQQLLHRLMGCKVLL